MAVGLQFKFLKMGSEKEDQRNKKGPALPGLSFVD